MPLYNPPLPCGATAGGPPVEFPHEADKVAFGVQASIIVPPHADSTSPIGTKASQPLTSEVLYV